MNVLTWRCRSGLRGGLSFGCEEGGVFRAPVFALDLSAGGDEDGPALGGGLVSTFSYDVSPRLRSVPASRSQ